MKRLFQILFILCCTKGIGQIISFDYDDAGNQIKRQLCNSCHNKTAMPLKEVADLRPSDLLKFTPEDVISYYPNPVKEELYLKWDLIDNNTVQSIQLFAINGAIIKNIDNLENQTNISIMFKDYSEGIFIIQLTYSNGAQKSISIVKQQ